MVIPSRRAKEDTLTQYVIGLVHEQDGNFGISFPDFAGCVAVGGSIEEAVEKGTSLLAFHAAGMIEDGLTLPVLRPLAALKADPEFSADFAGAVVVAIPLRLPERPVRLNISLDKSLVEQIDRAASAAGQTRSGFLAEAARSRLRA
jgi:predicted RNase H-like HicB family nuclease